MATQYSDSPGVQRLMELSEGEGASKRLDAETIASLTPGVREWLELPQKVLAQIEAENSQSESSRTHSLASAARLS